MSSIADRTLQEEWLDIKEKLTLNNIILYFIGMIVIGVGVGLMLRSNVGMSSWDTLNFAINEAVPKIPFGVAAAITALTTMFLTIWLYKRWSYLLMTVPIILTATFIFVFDEYIYAGLTYTQEWQNIGGYVIGLFLLPLGGSFMIITRLPAGVYDQFMLGVLYRLKSSKLALIRAIIEVTVVIIAFLLGVIADNPIGQIGYGTIIFSLLVGILISFYLKLFERIGLYEYQQTN